MAGESWEEFRMRWREVFRRLRDKAPRVDPVESEEVSTEDYIASVPKRGGPCE